MWIGVNNFVKRKSCLTEGGGTKRVFHLENQNGSHAEFRPFYRKNVWGACRVDQNEASRRYT